MDVSHKCSSHLTHCVTFHVRLFSLGAVAFALKMKPPSHLGVTYSPSLSPVREAGTPVTLTTSRWCGRGIADQALGSASVPFGDCDSLPELRWLTNRVQWPGTDSEAE